MMRRQSESCQILGFGRRAKLSLTSTPALPTWAGVGKMPRFQPHLLPFGLIVVAIALLGCGTVTTGQIHGRFVGYFGGPSLTGHSPQPVPIAGKVIFKSSTATYTLTAGKNGLFESTLPTGLYSVAGHPGKSFGCRVSPLTIKISSGANARLVVTCESPAI
jgi:hypothetical protein